LEWGERGKFERHQEKSDSMMLWWRGVRKSMGIPSF
jgi:hypothetical protein